MHSIYVTLDDSTAHSLAQLAPRIGVEYTRRGARAVLTARTERELADMQLACGRALRIHTRDRDPHAKACAGWL